MYCRICGDESKMLTKVVRFWDPDDGWVVGRLCSYCCAEAIDRKPLESDYAWDKRGELFSDEEDAISTIYG